MVNKKGFMRTLEAAIAAVLTFSVLFLLLPRVTVVEETPKQDILNGLQFNDEFRTCVLERNETCVEEIINESLPAFYREKYEIKLTNDKNYISSGIPSDTEVKTEVIYVAANMTKYNPVLVKLFYWT